MRTEGLSKRVNRKQEDGTELVRGIAYSAQLANTEGFDKRVLSLFQIIIHLTFLTSSLITCLIQCKHSLI